MRTSASSTSNNGQITGITDTTGTPEAGRSVSYTYDPLSRLKTAVTTGSTAYPQWGLSWIYDRWGNRTDQTVTAGTAPELHVLANNKNQIEDALDPNYFDYDAAGNLIKDGLRTFKYDAENRLTHLDGSPDQNYFYDGAGLRVKKVASGTTTRYIFSGTKVIAEYTGTTPTLSKEYIYAGSQLLATLSNTGIPTYHHPDHLSARVNTDSAGAVAGQQGHYPFGESWYSINTTTKWQFTTYERDSESGLDYAMFRYDSTRLGRFATPDPLAGTIWNPQSLNRYSYVLNDPVNLVDPLGLDFDEWFLYEYFVTAIVLETMTVWGQAGVLTPDNFDPTGFPNQLSTFSSLMDFFGPLVDEGALAECVKDLFGVTLAGFRESRPGGIGYFLGIGNVSGDKTQVPVPIVVSNDAAKYTSAQLTVVSDTKLLPGEFLKGWTPPTLPQAYDNFTANNLGPMETIITQVHELGHSLHIITSGSNVIPHRGGEAGKALQDCVRSKRGFRRGRS